MHVTVWRRFSWGLAILPEVKSFNMSIFHLYVAFSFFSCNPDVSGAVAYYQSCGQGRRTRERDSTEVSGFGRQTQGIRLLFVINRNLKY